MKHFIVVLILGYMIVSCGSQKSSTTKNSDAAAVSNTETDTVRIANDDLDYEIIIIEPGFNAWLAGKPPRGFYAEQFLERKNKQYVIEYNQRVMNPYGYDPNLYLQQINYHSNIHYGYEVNYLLYNYFLFFEERFDQKFTVSRG